MPNNVTNEVTFLGSTERIKELRDKCKTDKSLFSFQAFHPRPKELDGTTSPAKIVSEVELQEWKDKLANGKLKDWEKEYRPISEKESADLITSYGCNNWYDWNVKNWGTKWDCYDHRGDDDLSVIIFETAWSTPMYVLMELSRLFKDITIEVRYADEDFGSNVGTYTLQGGELVNLYQPDYSKDSVRLAMDILGDEEYWITDRLCEVEDELEGVELWLVEIAHEEGNLMLGYPIQVLERLFELAVADEQYERAGEIKNLLKISLGDLKQ